MVLNPVLCALIVPFYIFFTVYLPPRLWLLLLYSSVHWMSSWNDAIWLPSSPSSMVSMATVSNDWGRGSNWPIVSKLHFSEWFPLSCYWNRAPALWWIHLVIHSLEGKRGKYKHDTRGLASLKQSSYWMNKHTRARTVKQQFERGRKNTHTHGSQHAAATILATSFNWLCGLFLKKWQKLMSWISSPQVPTASCLLRPHKEW